LTVAGRGDQNRRVQSAANLETPAPTSIPVFVLDAVRRASEAELELGRILPLFMTKLRADGTDESSRELDAFSVQLRLSHAAAIHALHLFKSRRGAPEVVASAYLSLAVLIEQFTQRASLDSADLD
jgi:hypothetical protein